ncbi:MAG: primary-amine oxidase [Pirellulales bacterium]
MSKYPSPTAPSKLAVPLSRTGSDAPSSERASLATPETQHARRLSRRSFFGDAALIAGVGALPRLLEYPAIAASDSVASSAPPHPLDPLSADEMAAAVRIVRESGRLPADIRFVSCTLEEPDPETLARAATSSGDLQRKAFLVLLDKASGLAHEAVVDLTGATIERLDALPRGVQPSVMLDECIEAEQMIRQSPEFQAALAKRGVKKADLVMVEAWSAGNYGTELPEDAGRRRIRALCFVRSEATDNGFAHPLGGVVVIADLNKLEVLRIEDYGVTNLPPEPGNWAREFIPKVRRDLKPLTIEQPEGPSFTIDGHEVRWQKWRLRFGFTPREGLVLYDVRYDDDGRERSILRRAALCEMVVPYGDPGEQYYRKNAFDIGEFGMGTLANSLVLGCDCLGAIRYFDALMLDSRGKVVALKNAICVHEEDVGLLWKHTDWRTNQSEVRRSRRLSLSFVATVGNYDYAFYWHLYQDGSIHCEVKLTGIMNTTALPEPTEFGVQVAPGLNAPFHQHIFVARIDPAVDGPQNSVYEVNTAGLPRGDGNPHGNAFRATATLLATEHEAQRRVNGASARFWRVVNPQEKNRLGNPVGYRLVPGENSPPFAAADASVMQRAGFAAHHLWVTPYRADERYPAGDYPNQNPGGDGLVRWTAANRPVENTPLVLWYVFAHTHTPRVEDWPVMSAASIGFHLRPDGFFTRNPAMDVPPPG